ncbi:MAG TPA: hypothetical protein DDW52_14345 [Planctomycetaceae bacterium]|nr:hypothetical protein [Planctomycetaceae bacterium]
MGIPEDLAEPACEPMNISVFPKPRKPKLAPISQTFPKTARHVLLAAAVVPCQRFLLLPIRAGNSEFWCLTAMVGRGFSRG